MNCSLSRLAVPLPMAIAVIPYFLANPLISFAAAARLIKGFVQKYGVTAIAIGNGTASRESEQFIASLLPEMPGVAYMIVSEAGASVYSASKLAAAEFPDFDVTQRSAVSIARRKPRN